MDLVPKPGQVIAAAQNITHSVLYGGLADLRPMPRSLIAEGARRDVYHYRPTPGVVPEGDPVLLVTPLAAPPSCFDLRRGCSLVEHLVREGHPTYLVEYGQVSFKDRNLGIEHWVDTVVPTAIREASEHAGGRPVHVVGWSLGGIFALLTAADQPDLPIASITSMGAPFDVTEVPIVAPLRPLLNLTDGRGAITAAYRLLGGAPKPVVGWAFSLASVQKLVTKPLAVATHLDDADYLAQLEAVDAFKSNMIAYPGRTFGQIYHRFVKGNALVGGAFRLGDRTIDLAHLTAPVLVFAGATDGIAPAASVTAVVPLLTSAAEVRFEIVPGGHLGMLTGRAARTGTWVVLDEWVRQWSSAVAPTARRAKARSTGGAKRSAKKTAEKTAEASRKAARKRAASGSTTKKTAAKKTPARKAAPRKAAPRKTAPRKAAPRKTAPRKTAPRKTAPRKAAETADVAPAPTAADETGTLTETAAETGTPTPPAGESGTPTPPADESGTPTPPAGESGTPTPPADESGTPTPPADETGTPTAAETETEPGAAPTIGANPQRRYGSASSRALSG
jgi:poly[(R)-3-hydroxyalkanoate] polymerase subunit PhaC